MWADAHPWADAHQREELLDKACEWLLDQACCGWIEDVEANEFVERFKQAMK